MILYAQANAITLASDELYMSAKQLQHCMRTSKCTAEPTLLCSRLLQYCIALIFLENY
jgi:hypothetical protein